MSSGLLKLVFHECAECGLRRRGRRATSVGVDVRNRVLHLLRCAERLLRMVGENRRLPVRWLSNLAGKGPRRPPVVVSVSSSSALVHAPGPHRQSLAHKAAFATWERKCCRAARRACPPSARACSSHITAAPPSARACLTSHQPTTTYSRHVHSTRAEPELLQPHPAPPPTGTPRWCCGQSVAHIAASCARCVGCRGGARSRGCSANASHARIASTPARACMQSSCRRCGRAVEKAPPCVRCSCECCSILAGLLC